MSAVVAADDTEDGIVLLTVVTPKDSRLTKTLQRVDGAWKVARDFGGITRVNAREIPVHDIASLSDVLGTAARDPKTCVIRGGIRPGFEEIAVRPGGVRRLAYDRPDEIAGVSVFEERARRWIALDLDSFPLPAHIDPIEDAEHVIDAALERLPPEFGRASCFRQLTSGHGIKPGGRVRLFFWLSRPVTNAEAKRWIPASIADPSVHAIVQPIYVAAPIFPPGQRDFLTERHGLHLGIDDEVQVPDLETWTRDGTGGTAHGEGLHVASVDEALELMGDPPEWPDGRGFHAPIDAAFKAATQEFGSNLDQEALLAQVEAKLRERIGRRGDAYLNRRIRDARPWLTWFIEKAAERETRGPTVAPPGHGLLPYYPSATETRDAALARQNEVIRKVIAQAGRDAAIRRAVRAEIKAENAGS
ncbi:MAG: hypothetical protein EXR07_02065 [Acetobacteraceae bacterium]|nr:hypothetical protein [Acetobacteraceae bacterium]